MVVADGNWRARTEERKLSTQKNEWMDASFNSFHPMPFLKWGKFEGFFRDFCLNAAVAFALELAARASLSREG